MEFKDFSEEYKKRLLESLEALETTKNIGCPPNEYKEVGHTNCFHCNECWKYALRNSMNNKAKEQ